MAFSAPLASTTDVIDTCSVNTRSLIQESIGEILRQTGFDALEHKRDNALRAISRDEPEPVQYYFKQQKIFQEQCAELLRRIRPELHQAIDEVIDELETEVHVIEASGQLMSAGIPTKTARQLPGPAAFPGSQLRAPIADMTAERLPLRDRERSVTMAASGQPPASHSSLSLPVAIAAAGPSNALVRTTPPTSPQTKRAAVDVAPITPNKRTKTTMESSSKSGPSVTPNSKAKKAAAGQSKKTRVPDKEHDGEYENHVSGDELPPLGEIRRTARPKKHPAYEDKALRDDEFVES